MTEPEIDHRDLLLLGILSILWGGSFFFVGIAVKELPASTIVFGRVAIAALLLLLVLGFFRMKLPWEASLWFSLFVMGLLNNVAPFLMITLGQKQISSGLASVINATTPLFTVLIMAAFREERLIVPKVVGVLVGLIGVVILYSGEESFLAGRSSGIVLCFGAALSYGFAGLWARRKLTGIPPITSATGQLMCSSVIMAFIASFVDHPWQLHTPSVTTWLALFGLAAFSTALAYVLFFQILLRSGATNVMLVTLLIPVTAICLGYIFLRESINAREIVGAIVIGSALIIVDGRAFRWVQPKRDIKRRR
jgi:drug/metabolite transporter (DMT)-like permease